MAASQKKGGGGRKIGRNKKRPSSALQKFRTTANRAKRIAKAEKDRQPKKLKVPRGTARAKRRVGLARVSQLAAE
ncbi:MAG TPA: hypothetical protein VMU47_11075 [Caldimonas sp.]|nr:hypothetical protein [Caldimonas sp.]